MKKYILVLLALLFVFSGCVKKQVFMPLPFSFSESVELMTDGNGNINGQFIFPAQTFNTDIKAKLEELNEYVDINTVTIEGVSLEILDTNSPNSTIDLKLYVQSGSTQNPTELLELDNVSLGQILNEPQIVELNEDGVTVIKNVMTELVQNNTISNDLIAKASGTASSTSSTVTFDIEVSIVVSVIVRQCQEVFDMFGSSDEACD